jgi:hypothetical protein
MTIYDLHYAAQNLSWHVDQPAIQNNQARNDVPSRQHYRAARAESAAVVAAGGIYADKSSR